MIELKVPILTDDIIGAVKKMKKKDRDAFIEDPLALTSPIISIFWQYIDLLSAVNIALAVIVITIVLVIVKAVRKTKADMDKHLRGSDPATRKEQMENLAEKIRKREVSCTRCGRQTHALLGTGNQY